MTKETKRSSRSKRSAKKNTRAPRENSLNTDTQSNVTGEEKMDNHPEETSPVDVVEEELPVVEEKPIIETQEPVSRNHVFPEGPVKYRLKHSEDSLLANPIVRYGSVVLGLLLFYFLFFRKSNKGSNKPATQGPTIVDVTPSNPDKGAADDGDDDKKKSVRSSVNRVSSPRIVFGDLRKNPSLMVAPPMTPAVGSR